MTDPAPTGERAASDRGQTGRRQHASLDVAPELYDARASDTTRVSTTYRLSTEFK